MSTSSATDLSLAAQSVIDDGEVILERPDGSEGRYRKQRGRLSRVTDRASLWLVRGCAIAIAVLVVCLVGQLLLQSLPAIKAFGFGFVGSTDWNPVKGLYGMLPQLTGTIVTSLLAMLIAVPIGLGAAVFLSEDLLPPKLQQGAAFVLELLAAVPSVVYGLWGIFVLIPLLREPANWVNEHFGWLPLFSTPLTGPGVLPATIVLAIMVLPTIAALSREALRAVPAELRQGAYALGATRSETITGIIFPTASRAITAALMLALGRAMGETMAVAMLIGNSSTLSLSLLAPGTTISSHLANQFGEANGLQLSALMYAALVLLLVTIAVNLLANCLVRRR